MLIVKFQGGLGNQMFQYAFYKYLNQKNLVYADLSWFKNSSQDNMRPYMLNHVFGINLKELQAKKSPKTNSPFVFRVINKLILKNLNFKIIRTNDSYYVEYPQTRVDYYLSRKNGYLDGYWQSERYFLSAKNQVIKDFEFKIKDEKIIKTAKEINATKNSVSLHWRRGDYVNHSQLEVIKPNYFLSVLKRLVELKNINKVFVFTEDYDWVKNQLLSFNLNLNFRIISKELEGVEDYNEMYLISICENNIISNSSFSWWGAYLNKYEEKIVIAPKKWTKSEGYELSNKERVPSSWLRMEVN